MTDEQNKAIEQQWKDSFKLGGHKYPDIISDEAGNLLKPGTAEYLKQIERIKQKRGLI
ncbi:hypothetical protein HPK19_11865 [Arthrobacter citreus]|nr:hypothetical protein HPK19_11865 [Arthrobacter citreus]